MRHDHADRDRLTIGCDACIERVRVDQIVDALSEWLGTYYDDVEETDLATLPKATPHRLYEAYRQLRGYGHDVHDVRYVLATWQIERWDPVQGLFA